MFGKKKKRKEKEKLSTGKRKRRRRTSQQSQPIQKKYQNKQEDIPKPIQNIAKQKQKLKR